MCATTCTAILPFSGSGTSRRWWISNSKRRPLLFDERRLSEESDWQEGVKWCGIAQVSPRAAFHFLSKSRCGDATKRDVDPRRRVFLQSCGISGTGGCCESMRSARYATQALMECHKLQKYLLAYDLTSRERAALTSKRYVADNSYKHRPSFLMLSQIY
jgi:hypothetical protein